MAVETPDSLTSFISSVVLPSTAPNDIHGLVSKIEKVSFSFKILGIEFWSYSFLEAKYKCPFMIIFKILLTFQKCAPELFSRVRFTIEDFLRELHIALIVVDFQNDFVNGSLSILVNYLPRNLE